jgi:hypothetical protein
MLADDERDEAWAVSLASVEVWANGASFGVKINFVRCP